MDFMSLPVVMIENIFSYLSYDEIAKNRLVSRDFNQICMKMLNRGFVMIERRHALSLKNVKAQLPRRESERRCHQLSRHCDILTSIETRISMLNMTYSKYIDSGMCCFIPGKVIDEIKRILKIVESETMPPRAHEVLQELRDISSMAIEHFDDKISPPLRKKLQEGTHQPPSRPTQAILAPLAMRQEMACLRKRSKLHVRLSLQVASQYAKFNQKIKNYKSIVMRQQNIIKMMYKKQKEQDSTLADLKKRLEEIDIKYSELTHTNQAVGGKTIAAGAVTSSPAQPLRHFSSQIKLDLSDLPIGTSRRNPHKLFPNIKPRKAMIRLPSLSESDTEPPPKIPKLDNPNTSPKKTQSTLALIQGITNQITELNNLTLIVKSFEGSMKRPKVNDGMADIIAPKKMKKD